MKKTTPTALAVATVVALAFNAVPAHALSSVSPFAVSPSDVPAVSPSGLSQVENEIIHLTNQHRADHGLHPLQHDPALSANSRSWSEHMAAHRDFRHSDQWNVAENIAATSEPNPSARTFVDMWLNSDGHRANILNPQYNRIGVGLATSADGSTYATQQMIW